MRAQVLGDLIAAEAAPAGITGAGRGWLAGERGTGGHESRTLLHEGIVRRELAVERSEPLVDLAEHRARTACALAPRPASLRAISHDRTLPDP